MTMTKRSPFTATTEWTNEKPAKGFSMTFANGWTVSVQWGKANYCYPKHNPESNAMESETAEVWRWDENGVSPDDVRGHMTADEVLAYMTETAAFAGKAKKNYLSSADFAL